MNKPGPARGARTALVVGGGLVGAACAWQLQRAGWSTTLCDPDQPQQAASWGNAGHLATEQVEPLASLATLRSLPRRLFMRGGPVALPPGQILTWLPFGLRLLAAASPARFARGQRALTDLLQQALPAWRRLAAQVGMPHLLAEDGHYIAWESETSARERLQAWQAGPTGSATVLPASTGELDHLRSLFGGRPLAAARFAGTGQVRDLAAARSAVLSAFTAAGGRLRIGRVSGLVMRGRAAHLLLDGGGEATADAIVVAAGVASAGLLRGVEGRLPLIAERGYHVEATVDQDLWPADLPPVVLEDRSIIVTRFASTLRIAGFTEFSRADAPADERKWARLERHAAELALPLERERRRWMGCRPTLPDYLPVIGRSERADNLLHAFGHQHLGLTLAALTGELVAACADRGDPPIALAPFNLRRLR